MIRYLLIILLIFTGCGDPVLLTVKHYSQVEPPLSEIPIGKTTIRDAGCLTVNIASLANYYGDVSPRAFIAAMVRHGAYDARGNLGWSKTLSALSGATGVTWKHLYSVDSVAFYVKHGVPVLAFRRGHWRVIVGVRYGTAYCLDPAKGPEPERWKLREFERFDIWAPGHKIPEPKSLWGEIWN